MSVLWLLSNLRPKESMTLTWTLWLGAIVLSFAILETVAIRIRGKTFSRVVWDLSSVFPLLPFLAGLVTGVLAAHFWWGGILCFGGTT